MPRVQPATLLKVDESLKVGGTFSINRRGWSSLGGLRTRRKVSTKERTRTKLEHNSHLSSLAMASFKSKKTLRIQRETCVSECDTLLAVISNVSSLSLSTATERFTPTKRSIYSGPHSLATHKRWISPDWGRGCTHSPLFTITCFKFQLSA